MSVRQHSDGLDRCSWAGTDPLYVEYHDLEWGRPVRDQQALFEHLCLEGFQAGLSWLTILKRREGFRRALENFDIARVAGFGEQDVQRLMLDAGIIRNELKIRATIHNARLVLDRQLILADEFWEFAPAEPLTSELGFEWKVTSKESDELSKHLKRLGFKFVGSTSMYAMMQSAGMIRDHAPACYRRAEDRVELGVQ